MQNEDDEFILESSLEDALDLLSTSDDKIGLLLAEVIFMYSTIVFTVRISSKYNFFWHVCLNKGA